MLWQKDLPGADLVIRGARVLDPAEGIDARLEVRIDGGTIADVAERVDANGHRVVEAEFGIRMGATVPEGSGPHTSSTIARYVGSRSR